MPDGSARSRRLILLWLSIFIAGGVWKATQALRVSRPSLPLDALAAAARLASEQQAPPLPQLACAPRLQLSIVQFAASPELLLDGAALCRQHLQPLLAAHSLLPPANVSAAALLHPPPLPRTLLRRLQAPAQPSPEALGEPSRNAALRPDLAQHASRLLQLAYDTHQLPASRADHRSAAVLVHVAAAEAVDTVDGKQREMGGGGGGGSSGGHGRSGSPDVPSNPAPAPTLTAVGLKEDVLAVFVVVPGVPQQQGPGAQLGVLQQLAAAIAEWMADSMQPASPGAAGAGPLGDMEGSASTAQGQAAHSASGAAELAGACLACAGAMLRQFVATLHALPDMRIACDLSHLAARAAHEVAEAQHAQQAGRTWRALRLARTAWGSAWGVRHHPGFGVEAVFPAEHQMAVLLPLALPVALVVLRAAAKELRGWRQERRAAAAAAAGAKKND